MQNKKRILVTGANGQLGSEMRRLGEASPNDYHFTDVAELDITDKEAILAYGGNEGFDAIVNCAAYTNVDKAEDDIILCTELNAHAAENLAVAMKEVDGLLVHISTDYVFGGEPYNTPCKEDQKGTPTEAIHRYEKRIEEID
jgi:dTDP-4-dehydrorhamnose reductase